MNKYIKKLLVGSISLILFGSISIFESNHVNADTASYLLTEGLAHAPNMYTVNSEINFYNKNWYRIDHPSKREALKWKQEQADKTIPEWVKKKTANEKPLSEEYPYGATVERNGKIKVNHSKAYYRAIHHNKNIIKHLETKKRYVGRKAKIAKHIINILNHYDKNHEKARNSDDTWIAHHSYRNHVNFIVSRYKNPPKHKIFRAYGDTTGVIALSKTYKPVLYSAKLYTYHHKTHYYKVSNIVNMNKTPTYAKYLRWAKGGSIYQIRVHNQKYYYVSSGVRSRYNNDIEPYNTYGNKKCIYSNQKPNVKNIIVEPGTKISQSKTWLYEAPNEHETFYYLRGNTWQIEREDSPHWLNE